MYDAQRQASFRYGGFANNGVFGVEQDYFEYFVSEVSQARIVVVEEIGT